MSKDLKDEDIHQIYILLLLTEKLNNYSILDDDFRIYGEKLVLKYSSQM